MSIMNNHPVVVARQITVIETVTAVGQGTEDNPARYLKQYWDSKGNLLAETDGHKKEE